MPLYSVNVIVNELDDPSLLSNPLNNKDVFNYCSSDTARLSFCP
jgi:hypothetical protein